MTGPGPLPVLVARGGVAGPGSLLARRHLARERMERTLLTPGRGSSGTGPRHSPSCSRAGVRGGSARRDPRGLGGALWSAAPRSRIDHASRSRTPASGSPTRHGWSPSALEAIDAIGIQVQTRTLLVPACGREPPTP